MQGHAISLTEPLVTALAEVVGSAHVLTGPGATRRYVTGYRAGRGAAIAVVRPATLLEQWRVLKLCVAADVIVIVQSANTGLTGGSTPWGDYDRDVVVISTLRITGIHLIDGGRQVVCASGATLHALEKALRPVGREPHSVIGSSCIGASVAGGICNNSGGSLIRRGPAYTQLALYAHVDATGRLELVNHLGIRLGDDPETILRRLDRGDFAAEDVAHDGIGPASDHDYAAHVRAIHEATPARFNADPRRLFEASGSAGRVTVFAVRLDTFPAEADTAVFYIGTNDPEDLTRLRRHALSHFVTLPIAAEYMHRDAFDIAAQYGKDVFLAIRLLGTERLPMLYAVKSRIDRLAAMLRLRPDLSDRLLQGLSRMWPRHLPKRLRAFGRRYAHHLMLRVASEGIAEARRHLAEVFPNAQGEVFECTREEGDKAFLHRFAAAGAAVRYRAIHADAVEDIVALDIALPRNAEDWTETLPAALDGALLHRLYYGHFFCHVFHQDYIVARGHDPAAIEHRMLELLDRRGAECPAEHNVGHLYRAKPALADFYRDLDPQNRFNPGIGMTSRRKHWASAP